MKSMALAKQEGKLAYILEQLYKLSIEERCLIVDNLCDGLEMDLNQKIDLPSSILTKTDKLRTQFNENQ